MGGWPGSVVGEEVMWQEVVVKKGVGTRGKEGKLYNLRGREREGGKGEGGRKGKGGLLFNQDERQKKWQQCICPEHHVKNYM